MKKLKFLFNLQFYALYNYLLIFSQNIKMRDSIIQ